MFNLFRNMDSNPKSKKLLIFISQFSSGITFQDLNAINEIDSEENFLEWNKSLNYIITQRRNSDDKCMTISNLISKKAEKYYDDDSNPLKLNNNLTKSFFLSIKKYQTGIFCIKIEDFVAKFFFFYYFK